MLKCILKRQGLSFKKINDDICLGPCLRDGNAALNKAENEYISSIGNQARSDSIVAEGKITLKAIEAEALKCPLAKFTFVQNIFTELNELVTANTSQEVAANFMRLKVCQNY